MTYLELAQKVLEKADSPLHPKQIWQIAQDKNLDKKLTSVGKTPEKTLNANIYVDINRKGVNSIFIQTSKKPSLFWLKAREKELSKPQNLTNTQEIQAKKPEKSEKFHERDLHPLLVKYLGESKDFKRLFCKTIYHEKSPKSPKGKDKWIHPDLVGVHFPFDDYEQHTLDLLTKFSKPSHKIYSFELKKTLDFSNLKESYFQAVSNSSWANEGYLVVFESIDKELKAELTRLNASFGIGVIQLECEPLESQVLLNAKFREIDIDTLNLLVKKNEDFKEFIKNINTDVKIGEFKSINAQKYDIILKDKEMSEYIAKNHIEKE